jgi:hypothetical protein
MSNHPHPPLNRRLYDGSVNAKAATFRQSTGGFSLPFTKRFLLLCNKFLKAAAGARHSEVSSTLAITNGGNARVGQEAFAGGACSRPGCSNAYAPHSWQSAERSALSIAVPGPPPGRAHPSAVGAGSEVTPTLSMPGTAGSARVVLDESVR